MFSLASYFWKSYLRVLRRLCVCVCWIPIEFLDTDCNCKWINKRPSHHFQIHIWLPMSRATAQKATQELMLVSPVWLTNWFWNTPKNIQKQWNSCKIEPTQLEWCGATKPNDGTSSTSSLQNGKKLIYRNCHQSQTTKKNEGETATKGFLEGRFLLSTFFM